MDTLLRAFLACKMQTWRCYHRTQRALQRVVPVCALICGQGMALDSRIQDRIKAFERSVDHIGASLAMLRREVCHCATGIERHMDIHARCPGDPHRRPERNPEPARRAEDQDRLSEPDRLPVRQARANREPYQPDRYGDRWAPVIVGFTDEKHIPALAGDVAGVAAPMPITRTDLDYSVITTASLWLDTTLLDEPGTSSGPAWLPVLRHEFGHVIGLDHVDDPSQLMNPKSVAGIDDYQSGDLYGLAQLGRGRCAPDF